MLVQLYSINLSFNFHSFTGSEQDSWLWNISTSRGDQVQRQFLQIKFGPFDALKYDYVIWGLQRNNWMWPIIIWYSAYIKACYDILLSLDQTCYFPPTGFNARLVSGSERGRKFLRAEGSPTLFGFSNHRQVVFLNYSQFWGVFQTKATYSHV